MQLWGLASLKYAGELSRLETQTGVDVRVLSVKFVGQAGRLEAQVLFLSYHRIPFLRGLSLGS